MGQAGHFGRHFMRDWCLHTIMVSSDYGCVQAKNILWLVFFQLGHTICSRIEESLTVS